MIIKMLTQTTDIENRENMCFYSSPFYIEKSIIVKIDEKQILAPSMSSSL
jgi:hypothetical protein